MANKKLVLIDGHSILNRAFYGMPDLTNVRGVHTGAVYGFLNILFKILEEEQADYLAVAFDVHAKTFRHEYYDQYKGTRKPMPEELRTQVPLMKEVLTSMGVLLYEQAGLEADDILGTLAKKSEAAGMDVSLVSGDRDLLQIASDRICIRIPKTKNGQTTVINYHTQDVIDQYQVTPKQFIDLKALMGDTADNIPGVPKVGEKTATDLIVKYGSVEGVYEHLEEITKKALHATLSEHRDLADMSLFLVTIKIDCDVTLDEEKAKLTNLYTKEAYAMYQELGFKNLLKRFSEEDTKETVAAPSTKDCVVTSDLQETESYFASLQELISKSSKDSPVYLGVQPIFDEITGCVSEPAKLLGVAIANQEKQFCFIAEGFVTGTYLSEQLNKLYRTAREQDGAFLCCFDVKNQYPFYQIPLADCDAIGAMERILTPFFDVLIGSYLCNPLKNDYEPSDVATEYLKESLIPFAVKFPKMSVGETLAKEQEALASYEMSVAGILADAAPIIRKRLIDEGMWELYHGMELPLSYILFDMERLGIRAVREALKEYGDQLTGRIAELENKIHEETGSDFNISSPKQLGEVLFEKMEIPGGKKTKTGYSTAADVLQKLAPEYPVIHDILEYRGLTKLKSTYADGLANFIGEDGRIHTTFHQTITATGRISSADPNLQNIPMRTELGRAIRKVFLPSEGCTFTDADYSQIELRILAHMSGDEELIAAYQQNKDIHRITASKVFHTPFEEVTPLQRRNAKAVNFGIVYGISAFGLSEDLSISRKEAASYIDSYFATYPGIKTFLTQSVEDAKTNGYVTTLFGRRRPVPELASGNFMTRQFGERVAMNSPIQGTAADIMKIAMIHVFEALHAKKLKSELILQIHDELLIETAAGEEDCVKELLSKEMYEAAQLKVGLETEVGSGNTWYDCK